jgi:hypothetical protein
MTSQQKNVPIGLVLVIVAGVVFGACLYYLFLKSELFSSAVTPSASTTISASTSLSVASTSVPVAQIDTSAWQTFTSYELGYSIQYPPDVTVDSSNPAVFEVTFPRETYFSTVYADDVSVSVTENPTCPANDQGATVAPSENVVIGGVNFTKNETGDIAAGNVYDTVTYDAPNNDVCYQILFSDRHANGAGLYESDPAQIAALTTARDAEFAHVSDIVNAMISSFNFVSTPVGENEADYNASAAPASAIFISTISSTTVSVGAKLTIIGQGFSGENTLVQISNGSVQGVLWGGVPTSDTAISTIIPDKVCTAYIATSGISCPSYLIISPGIYTIDVSNQNGTTDTVYLKVQ